MSVGLRIILVFISFLTLTFIIRKIRQSKLQIEYTLFWLGFSILLLVLSLFPQIVYWLTDFVGVQSPVNFVFLIVIFILIIKNFFMTLQIAKMEERFQNLVQELGIQEMEKRKEK